MRRVPHSGRWPQFRQRALEASLAGAGVRYTWEGEALGGLRDAADAAASARHGAISQPMFAAYAAHMESDAFRTGVERVRDAARSTRVVLLCAERDPRDCHRSYIADWLCAHGDEVIHLLHTGERVEHALRREARLDGDILVYDRRPQGQLELDA